MKIKFTHFERVAGLFVVLSFVGFFLFLVSVAVNKGWFEPKTYFHTKFQAADGLHSGSAVMMAGLKAGQVDEVELLPSNEIFVKFYVLSKFKDKIRESSEVFLIRPFVIGERALEVTVGDGMAPALAENAQVKSKDSVDLMSLLSGKNLNESLQAFSGLVENAKMLVQAFADKDRMSSMIDTFDRVAPLVKNLNTMSTEVILLTKQLNKDERIGSVMKELAVTTKELNQIIPQLNAAAPQMGQDMAALVKNLSLLTGEFKVFIPALAEVAPDLPHASRRAVEALDEAVVLVKAMQRTFLVKGAAEDVREEEAKLREQREKERLPASK